MKPINLPEKPRILVTRVDRIGDVVLSTPVFPAIKAKYPESHVALIVVKGREALVEGNPWIDEVIAYDKKGKDGSWWETFLFSQSLRRKKFDVVINLHATNRVNLISWLAGIPIRIGYKRKNYQLLTHAIEERKREGEFHEAEYNFDLLRLIEVPKPEHLELYFPLNQADGVSFRSQSPELEGKRYVVFHPSASCPSKIWPVQKMAELADRMVEQYGIFPVIVAGFDGVKESSAMSSVMKNKHLNLGGKLSLGVLGWVLKNTRLLVSNDSGPVHIACAVGTPVISIFGRNQAGLSAKRWGPLSQKSSWIQKDVGCIECFAHDCRIDFKCLKELTVSDLLDEVKKYEQNLA